MSRAFIKNDDPDEPPVIPPRAPLPPGTINYVTPRGLALLKAELTELEAQRTHAQSDTSDSAARKHRLALLNGSIGDLKERIASAKVVDSHAQPRDKVLFGATVTVRTLTGTNQGEERRFTIVGVDEAAAAEGRVAFTAPLARAILGQRVGEQAVLRTAQGEETLEIEDIQHEK